MLSIATRTVLRPTLARSLALRASSIYTLPDLPYAYNVKLILLQNFLYTKLTIIAGPRTTHF